MNKQRMAELFNEWMRRYIENPDLFLREFEAVSQFKGGTYGDCAAAYMEKLNAEMPQ